MNPKPVLIHLFWLTLVIVGFVRADAQNARTIASCQGPLVNSLRRQTTASSFCLSYLGISTTTITDTEYSITHTTGTIIFGTATTPATVDAPTTVTVPYVKTVTSFICPAQTTAAKAKREAAPLALPAPARPTPPGRLSSACSCLSLTTPTQYTTITLSGTITSTAISTAPNSVTVTTTRTFSDATSTVYTSATGNPSAFLLQNSTGWYSANNQYFGWQFNFWTRDQAVIWTVNATSHEFQWNLTAGIQAAAVNAGRTLTRQITSGVLAMLHPEDYDGSGAAPVTGSACGGVASFDGYTAADIQQCDWNAGEQILQDILFLRPTVESGRFPFNCRGTQLLVEYV